MEVDYLLTAKKDRIWRRTNPLQAFFSPCWQVKVRVRQCFLLSVEKPTWSFLCQARYCVRVVKFIEPSQFDLEIVHNCRYWTQDTNLLGFCSPARIVSNRVFWLNYLFCASVLQLLLFTMNYLCSSSNSCSSKDARRSRAAAKVLKDGFLFKEKPPPPLPAGNISRLWFDQHFNVHFDVSVHSVLLLLQHLFSLQLQRKVKNGEKSMEDRNKTTTTRVSHCRGIR